MIYVNLKGWPDVLFYLDMSSFQTYKMRPAGIPKMSGILPRRIFVFLWVFHKLVITPLQALEMVSPLRSTFLRELWL